MAHGKHPLDVFRSSGSGFDRASRQRRTVSGKVISSSAREPGEADPGSGSNRRTSSSSKRLKSKAPPRRAAAPAPRRPSSARARKAAEREDPAEPRRGLRPPLSARSGFKFNAKLVSQGLFSLVLLVLAAGAVWMVAQTDWSGHGLALKTADAASVLEPGPGAGQAPVTVWHTVRVATYSMTDAGVAAAWAARDELVSRGYRVFDPVATEQTGEDGVVRQTNCQLLVGQAASPAELNALRDELKAINDWPTGDPVPFGKPEVARLPEVLIP
ncbi:MAG: hypothetical protein DRQ55_03895 [Planctomycetota bacterium]|nr:MAG: hypothetical protein DRQ55_03895 [Planctomycetota bacterium]